MTFDRARAIADAVLFEGYALYPYRATSTKNQAMRWQFGVLVPRVTSEATRTDPWWLEAQALVEPGAVVSGRLRFLRVRRRTIVGAASVEVDGQLVVPWDEGELVERDFAVPGVTVIELPGDREEQGPIVRERAPISLRVEATLDERLRVRVENVGAGPTDPRAHRDTALPFATLSTHLLFHGGPFHSLIDPPPGAPACKNTGVYPILAGRPGERDLLLASPIILYDHPSVAPESPGDLFDATEIDEILTLRTMLLTDEEKRLARATDPRVAALLDRVERMSPEVMSRLHGAIRKGPGARVRLRPGKRRTDAQDMFLDGRVATIREIQHDVDGRTCFAVTIDDDPAADLHLQHGRYHYFYADEIETLDG